MFQYPSTLSLPNVFSIARLSLLGMMLSVTERDLDITQIIYYMYIYMYLSTGYEDDSKFIIPRDSIFFKSHIYWLWGR